LPRLWSIWERLTSSFNLRCRQLWLPHQGRVTRSGASALETRLIRSYRKRLGSHALTKCKQFLHVRSGWHEVACGMSHLSVFQALQPRCPVGVPFSVPVQMLVELSSYAGRSKPGQQPKCSNAATQRLSSPSSSRAGSATTPAHRKRRSPGVPCRSSAWRFG
jgi:hypothetical protein